MDSRSSAREPMRPARVHAGRSPAPSHGTPSVRLSDQTPSGPPSSRARAGQQATVEGDALRWGSVDKLPDEHIWLLVRRMRHRPGPRLLTGEDGVISNRLRIEVGERDEPRTVRAKARIRAQRRSCQDEPAYCDDARYP